MFRLGSAKLLDAIRYAAEELSSPGSRSRPRVSSADRIRGEAACRKWSGSSNGSTRRICSGHWNPEIIAMAGGREVDRPSQASRVPAPGLGRRSPKPTPEVLILISACGFSIDRAEVDLALLADLPRVAGPPSGPQRPARPHRRIGLLLPAGPSTRRQLADRRVGHPPGCARRLGSPRLLASGPDPSLRVESRPHRRTQFDRRITWWVKARSADLQAESGRTSRAAEAFEA